MFDQLREIDRQDTWRAALIAAEIHNANPYRKSRQPVRPRHIVSGIEGKRATTLDDDRVRRLKMLATGELLLGEIQPDEAN